MPDTDPAPSAGEVLAALERIESRVIALERRDREAAVRESAELWQRFDTAGRGGGRGLLILLTIAFLIGWVLAGWIDNNRNDDEQGRPE